MTARSGIIQVVLSLEVGGTERLVLELARRLSDLGPMSIVCLDEPGRLAEEARGRGIDVTALGRRPGFDLKLGRRLARLARERGAGLLHCHQYSPFIYGALAGLWDRGLAVIATEHGRLAGERPRLKRRLANALFSRLPQGLYAVSEDLRRSMIGEGFSSERLEVITNGVEVGPAPSEEQRREGRALLGLEASATVVGSVARFDPVKELTVAVAGFEALAKVDPQARLVLVGDGAEEARIREEVARRGLAEQVVLPGYRADARAIMAGFDIYLNSSQSEGISLTLLEAMAAGLPIVATRVGGNPEVVIDGRTGILVARGDAAAAGAALRSLAGDPARARSLGAAGRARLEERFSLEAMIAAYRRVYRRALEGAEPCAASAGS